MSTTRPSILRTRIRPMMPRFSGSSRQLSAGIKDLLGIGWRGPVSTVPQGIREEPMVGASPGLARHLLKALRDRLGLKVRGRRHLVLEPLPRARCDSEAYVYLFAWDKGLLQEWEWSERYPKQPEILRHQDQLPPGAMSPAVRRGGGRWR